MRQGQEEYTRVGATARPEQRDPALDGVRGLAVAMVLLYHAFSWSMGTGGWSLVPTVVERVTRVGWLGVDLFFVLSGFLITGILLDSRRDPRYYRNFYARRALRILPLFYLTLAALLILYAGSGKFVLLSVMFLANLTALFGVPVLYGPLWSLAVEEHFYLVWPWLVRVASERALIIFAIGLAVGEPILRYAGFHAGQDTHLLTWFRLDGLAWGALLAILRHQGSVRLDRMASWAFVGGVAMLVGGAPFGILSRKTAFGAALQYTPWTLIFFAVVTQVVSVRDGIVARAFTWRGLRRLGDLSYCLYLIHILLFLLYDRTAEALGLHPEVAIGRFGAIAVRAALALGCSVLIAELSFRFVETPILRLKRHFARSQEVEVPPLKATA